MRDSARGAEQCKGIASLSINGDRSTMLKVRFGGDVGLTDKVRMNREHLDKRQSTLTDRPPRQTTICTHQPTATHRTFLSSSPLIYAQCTPQLFTEQCCQRLAPRPMLVRMQTMVLPVLTDEPQWYFQSIHSTALCLHNIGIS